MPRVQCFECDMPVVVDPNGRCPEGHDLGPVGERIEQSLGRNEPHPDEPEPWVSTLEGSEPIASEHAEPRLAQPISVGPGPADDDSGGSTDGLLQELHALHGADDALTADRAGTPPPRDPAPKPPATPRPTSPTAEGTATSGPTAPASPQDAPQHGDTPATDPWDDWEDWDGWDDPTTPQSTADDPLSDPADRDDHTAVDADPAPTGADATDDQPAPAPTPRRAPTLRTEESMSAIAELAALLDDDQPARPATAAPPPATTPADDDRVPSGDGLATVSRLPQRPPSGSNSASPPPPPPASADADTASPPPPPTAADADEQEDDAPQPGQAAASGDGIDWTNFTAKGKKRRFGR